MHLTTRKRGIAALRREEKRRKEKKKPSLPKVRERTLSPSLQWCVCMANPLSLSLPFLTQLDRPSFVFFFSSFFAQKEEEEMMGKAEEEEFQMQKASLVCVCVCHAAFLFSFFLKLDPICSWSKRADEPQEDQKKKAKETLLLR